MSRVVVLGASGLLGSTLVEYLTAAGYSVTTIAHTSKSSDYVFDASDSLIFDATLHEILPDYIVNLAALTNVDVCEKNLSHAFRVNTQIAENVGFYAEKNGVFAVHISTDHFYDGDGSIDAKGASEKDVVIVNNYAMTKYCAEKAFSHVSAVVLRTNFFGKSHSKKSKGFCDSFYQTALDGELLTLFDDVFFSPLSITTLCFIIKTCLQKQIAGTYNVGSKCGLTKAAFILKFLDSAGVTNTNYKLVSYASVGLKTSRPKDMRMNSSLFEKMYQLTLPNLADEIAKVANEYVA